MQIHHVIIMNVANHVAANIVLGSKLLDYHLKTAWKQFFQDTKLCITVKVDAALTFEDNMHQNLDSFARGV